MFIKNNVDQIKGSLAQFLGANVAEKRAIVRGFSLSYVDMGVALILSFTLVPLMLSHLGQSAYGLWGTLGSIVGYFGLTTDLGMSASVVKYTAEYHTRGSSEDLSRLLSTLIVMFLLMGGLLVLVSLVLEPFIQPIFHLPNGMVVTGQVAFIIMSVNTALTVLYGATLNIIYGYQRVDVLKTISVICNITNAALILVVLNLGWGLVGVVMASGFAITIAMTIAIIYLNRSRYSWSFNPRLFSISVLKEIGPYSLRSFVLGLTAQVLYRSDNLVIGMMLGVAMVTPYSLAYKLCFLGVTLAYKIKDTIQPTFTRLYTLADFDGLRALFLKTQRLSTIITVPVAIFLSVLGPDFIDLWVGKENFAGMDVLIVLVLINFLHMLAPCSSLLQAIGKNRAVMYSSIADAILNLTLSIALARPLGLLGVALGTLLAHLCTDSWVVIWSACKNIQLPLHTYFSSAILPPFAAGIPTLFISIFWIQNSMANSMFAILLKGALLVLTYAGFMVIFWALSQKRKNTIQVT